MKYIIVIATIVMTACTGLPNKERSITESQFDSNGGLIRQTTTEDASTASDRDIQAGIQKCRADEAKVLLGISDPTAQVALAGFKALSQVDTCAGDATSNDVLIAGQQEITKRFGIITAPIATVTGIVVGGQVAKESVRTREATVVNQPTPVQIPAGEVVVVQPEVIVVEPTIVDPVIVDPVIVP